jgi:Spy/CpxP family protein refolding chaperone
MRTFLRSLIVAGSVAAAATAFTTARADSPFGQSMPGPSSPFNTGSAQPSQGASPFGAPLPGQGGTTAVPGSANPAVPSPGPTGQPSPAVPSAQGQAADQGGIVQLVEEALSGIDLSPQQKDEIQKLGADVNQHVGDVDKAKRDLLLDLAKEIESGQIDESTLKPDEDKVDRAAEAASPDLRSAFQKMHDVLNADQRKEFVTGFRDALHKREPKLDTKSQVDELAKNLSLTDDQKQKISGILDEDKAANDETRGRLDKVLDAFPSDSFSIDDVLPAGSVKDRGDKMMHRIVDQTRKVAAVLTPEQRAKAAKAIRDGLSEHAENPQEPTTPSTGPTGPTTGPTSPGQTAPTVPGETAPTQPGQLGPTAPGQFGPTMPGQMGPTFPGQTAPTGQPGQTGQTLSPLTVAPHEVTGSESQAFWAGRGVAVGRGFGYGGLGYGGLGYGGAYGFGVGRAYGFGRGYATGFGGAWMF